MVHGQQQQISANVSIAKLIILHQSDFYGSI